MKSTHTNPPEKICRLCLSASGIILPIFDGEVAERFPVSLPQKILICLSIKVCIDDPLPPHICHRCLYEVDRFYEFRETCKRTNTTFNKICNNSSENIPFDVNQVLEIKQELHDESVYHDAISELLSDDDGSDVITLCTRKRMRCRSLLESMKRVQQTQSSSVSAEVLAAPSTSTEQLSSVWMEQSKESTTTNSTSAAMQPQFECRYCSKPFMYQTNLLQHEELHAKGVTGDDSIEHIEHSTDPLSSSHDHPLQSSGQVAHPPQVETHNPPEPESSTGPLPPAPVPPPPPAPSTESSAAVVENVTLTDVTAMLLEGAFEGVRPLPSHPSNACRFCHEQLDNPDLLKRHERLYCNRKPSLLKHKHHMHQLHQPSIGTQQPNEHVLQQHAASHLQQEQPTHVHHIVIQHQPDPQSQQQQILIAQKEIKDSNFGSVLKACKHCHKDFVHRGSLWRHQMFCDANPDKDINRAVAGTKKKTFVSKHLDGGIPVISNPIHSAIALGNHLLAGPIRRGGGQATSGPFKCKYCEKRFLHRGSWWRHQKMFCSDNPDTPTVRAAAAAAAAAAKERNAQEVGGFACRYCDRTFVHRGSCWHHEQTHSGIREHACRYCSKTFNEKSRLARHERMHLGIKPFTCNQCGKAFCDASNLRNHEQIHGERACFLCAWCGKSYTRRPLLLKHEQVHAGEGQVFTCSTCPRTFPDTETLSAHMISHTQEKSKKLYVCQTCGQAFRSQSMLSHHSQNIHGSMLVVEQQQQHSQNPGQSHAQQLLHPQPQIKQGQQHQHLSDQETQRHLICSVCSKGFSDFSSLRHHQLLHSGAPRQYRCTDASCNATFLQRNQLEAHVLLHEKSHSALSIAAPTSAIFHQQDQPLLQTHEMQHLHHHELLHRSATYILEGETLSGQALTVHHLVGHLPQ